MRLLSRLEAKQQSGAIRYLLFGNRLKGSFRNNFPVLNADPSRLAALLVG